MMTAHLVVGEVHPEARPRPLDGVIPANSTDLLGAEFAFVKDSLSFQGEYIHSWVNSEEGGTLQFKGCYAYVSYFLIYA